MISAAAKAKLWPNGAPKRGSGRRSASAPPGVTDKGANADGSPRGKGKAAWRGKGGKGAGKGKGDQRTPRKALVLACHKFRSHGKKLEDGGCDKGNNCQWPHMPDTEYQKRV